MYPVGIIAKKCNLKECVFVNSALKIQCFGDFAHWVLELKMNQYSCRL